MLRNGAKAFGSSPLSVTPSMDNLSRLALSKNAAVAASSSPPNGDPCRVLKNPRRTSAVSIPPNSKLTPCVLSIAIAAAVSFNARSAAAVVSSASNSSHAARPNAVDARAAKNARVSSHPALVNDFSYNSSLTRRASRAVGPHARTSSSSCALSNTSSSTTSERRARLRRSRRRRCAMPATARDVRHRSTAGDDDDVDARGIALDVRGGVRDANERARPIARVRIALDAIHVVSVANAVARARIRGVERRRWRR
mmetsp:Transcript_4974/g.18072  ORF Transcript_4974/g.18072 Transcript_4974/m.18072 type:complete len:254 (+) Transcript_4974:2620-3381(+)